MRSSVLITILSISQLLSEAECQSLEKCDALLWNVTNASHTWTGEVKVLPALNGEESYPDSYSDIQLVFDVGRDKDGNLNNPAYVTSNLTRSNGYDTNKYSTPPTCKTKYQYNCLKETSLSITPYCTYMTATQAADCNCGESGSNSACAPVDEGGNCYQISDPYALQEQCDFPCTGFFWCEHFLLSYETTTFSLLFEHAGKFDTDPYTLKMTTAGKFESGCGDTEKSTYQLQAFLYSGTHANPYVETTWYIIVGCAGGALLIFGGGWVIFFLLTREKKGDEEKEQIEKRQVTASSTNLCAPLLHAAEGADDGGLRCPDCHAIVMSTHDRRCSNKLCNKPYRYYIKWTREHGEVQVETQFSDDDDDDDYVSAETA